MVRSEKRFSNGVTLCQNFGKAMAEAVQNWTRSDIHELLKLLKDLNGICPECYKKVTYKSEAVECEICFNLYHVYIRLLVREHR